MTKWWSRQPDPFGLDPTWKGQFNTEANAKASLMPMSSEPWDGSVWEKPDDFDPRPDASRSARDSPEDAEPAHEVQFKYASGITSYVDWTFDGDTFTVTGQDFKPGGGEYEYIATVTRENLPRLAEALGTDVSGIETAWADQIEEINNPGFVEWLTANGIEFKFFTWHDWDWFS